MSIATRVIRLSCSVSASLLDHPRRDTHRKQTGLAEKALGHFRSFSGCCFWNLINLNEKFFYSSCKNFCHVFIQPRLCVNAVYM